MQDGRIHPSVAITAPKIPDICIPTKVAEFTANTIIHAKMIGSIVMISDEEVEEINKAFNLE